MYTQLDMVCCLICSKSSNTLDTMIVSQNRYHCYVLIIPHSVVQRKFNSSAYENWLTHPAWACDAITCVLNDKPLTFFPSSGDWCAGKVPWLCFLYHYYIILSFYYYLNCVLSQLCYHSAQKMPSSSLRWALPLVTLRYDADASNSQDEFEGDSLLKDTSSFDYEKRLPLSNDKPCGNGRCRWKAIRHRYQGAWPSLIRYTVFAILSFTSAAYYFWRILPGMFFCPIDSDSS